MRATLIILLCFGCSDELPEGEGSGGPGQPAPGQAPPGSGVPGDNVPGASPGENGGNGGNPDGQPGEDPLDQELFEFCEGEGPVVEVPDAQEVNFETCTGDIAERIFTNALCLCENARLAGYLRTRGFDSREGAFMDQDDFGGGAPVGINGGYELGAGYTDVGGSLSIAGAAGLQFLGYLRVFGDLRLGGTTTIPGYARIERDAWFGADFTSVGPLRVGRDLHQGAGLFALPLDVGRQTIQEAVQVDAPCPCDDLLDVQAVVDQVRDRNDNHIVGLRTEAFKQVVGQAHAELPCGRYYLDEISGLGDMEFRVTGRAVLVVGGNVAGVGSLRFEIAPGAEIDIFIAGELGAIGAISFGDKDRPSATRIYVGTTEDIAIIGASAFVGNLYAPRAKVTAPGYLRAYGSIFARTLEVPGYVNISYDRSITELCDEPEPDPMREPDPEGEVPPPQPRPRPEPGGDLPPGYTCDLCGDCSDGLACTDSRCQPCTEDAHCCGQQICEEGRCVTLIR